MNQNKLNDATAPRSVDQQQACSAKYVETDEERCARLKRHVGAMDAMLIKQSCPEISDDFILSMMFEGR